MQYQPSCSCRTRGAPKPSLLFWAGGGLTCAGYPQLPQASRLGQGQGPARGSWGRQGLGDSGIALSRSHFSFLYLGWVLAGDKCPPHGPRCWRLAMGMAGVPLHCRLGWLLFFFSLYDNNYYIVCFRFFNKAFSPALLAPGWLAAGLCHHGGPTAVLSPLQKITWGCAVEVTRVMYW